MLIIRTYVNDNEIDIIAIQNTRHVNKEIWEYRIRKPLGYNEIPILHVRDTGWMPLLEKALLIIQNCKPSGKGSPGIKTVKGSRARKVTGPSRK